MFESNSAPGGFGGGFSATNNVNVTINGSVFRGNDADAGGGLFAQLAVVDINDSLIAGNTATDGGGLYQGASNVGTFTLTRTTVADNAASLAGGGLYVIGSVASVATVVNSTFTGNTAPIFGGGIMLNGGGMLDIRYSTVVNNISTDNVNSVGGINAFAGEMTIGSTIVANNQNVDCSATSGSTSLDYNITTGPSDFAVTRWCSFVPIQPDDQTDTDPLLNPLSTAGNLQSFYTLQAGSPAIDAVATGCPAALDGIDQRGVPREAGNCDVGAISAAEVTLPEVYFAQSAVRIDDEGTATGIENIEIVIDNSAGNLSAPGSLPLTIYVVATGTATDTRDYASGIAAPTILTVDTSNWVPPGDTGTVSIPISVLDDLLIEGDETIDLNIAVTGPGSLRSAQSRATVTIVDDDFAGFTLSEQQVNLSDAVTTGTFTAVLDAQPTGTVLLRVVSSDGSAVVADVDALTFDAENWNTPQTVTVTGVGDVGALAGTAIIVAVDATATTTDVFDSVGAQTVSIVLEGQDDGGQDDGE
ncbi:MAG: choice-of-anchor Q domain-containing protein, partial [Chloroflexota bacterium]